MQSHKAGSMEAASLAAIPREIRRASNNRGPV